MTAKEFYEKHVGKKVVWGKDTGFVAGYSEEEDRVIIGSNECKLCWYSTNDDDIIGLTYDSYAYCKVEDISLCFDFWEDVNGRMNLDIIPPYGYEVDDDFTTTDRIVFKKIDTNLIEEDLRIPESNILLDSMFPYASVRVLADSTPDSHPELKHRALCVRPDVKVEVGEAKDGHTYIAFKKKLK